jgi:hypothetical protein
MTVTVQMDSTSTRLWNAQEGQLELDSNAEVFAVVTQDSDENIMTNLEAEHAYNYTGFVTANRLTSQSAYSDDPRTALAEWVAQMDAYINGSQGSGATLQDNDRGRTVTGGLESFGWQNNRGEKYQVDYDLTLLRGEVTAPDEPISPDPVNPTSTASLDGYDLGDLRTWRSTKRQKLEVFTFYAGAEEDAYDDAEGPNGITTDSGAIRRFNMGGRITGESRVTSFDDNMESLVGTNNTAEFVEPLTGRSFTVTVANYNSTRESGISRTMSYDLELIEGEIDFDEGGGN